VEAVLGGNFGGSASINTRAQKMCDKIIIRPVLIKHFKAAVIPV
jgi:hypothetical protein